jgi:hypothetical protein
MITRILTAILAVCLLSGCPMSDKKPAKGKTKPAEPTTDNSGDVNFQSVVGRLREAVRRRDTAMLASMMAQDFGYRWDNPPEGETPFAYWDRLNLWGELAAVLRERWVPHDGFMVVPPQFAANPEYNGYRAGLKQVDGNWRLAYFVSPPPKER